VFNILGDTLDANSQENYLMNGFSSSSIPSMFASRMMFNLKEAGNRRLVVIGSGESNDVHVDSFSIQM
jgi:hypothetical protein